MVASDWFEPVSHVAGRLPEIGALAVICGVPERQSRRDGDVIPLTGVSAMPGEWKDTPPPETLPGRHTNGICPDSLPSGREPKPHGCEAPGQGGMQEAKQPAA